MLDPNRDVRRGASRFVIDGVDGGERRGQQRQCENYRDHGSGYFPGPLHMDQESPTLPPEAILQENTSAGTLPLPILPVEPLVTRNWLEVISVTPARTDRTGALQKDTLKSGSRAGETRSP